MSRLPSIKRNLQQKKRLFNLSFVKYQQSIHSLSLKLQKRQVPIHV